MLVTFSVKIGLLFQYVAGVVTGVITNRSIIEGLKRCL